jgi:hypothetical protein
MWGSGLENDDGLWIDNMFMQGFVLGSEFGALE